MYSYGDSFCYERPLTATSTYAERNSNGYTPIFGHSKALCGRYNSGSGTHQSSGVLTEVEQALGACASRREGSSPFIRTKTSSLEPARRKMSASEWAVVSKQLPGSS